MMFQVFGTKKCKETQKAIRFFKERRIPYQFIDFAEKSLSYGELKNILEFYTLDELIDIESYEYKKRNFEYINHDKEDIALEFPLILKTPIIRINRKVKIGFSKEDLESWGV